MRSSYYILYIVYECGNEYDNKINKVVKFYYYNNLIIYFNVK